jgi:predicted PurR-regulated permease PerM
MSHASNLEITSIVPDAPLPVGENVEKRIEMPMPRDWPSFALTAILVLLVLVILCYSGEVVLPILFAFLLNLLLQPVMNALIKLHVPKTVAALTIIMVFVSAITGIGFSLSGPAAEWISKAPQSIARLEERRPLRPRIR